MDINSNSAPEYQETLSTEYEHGLLNHINSSIDISSKKMSEFNHRAEEALRFYGNSQWSDADEQRLRNMGVKPLTFNMISKQVNSLCGQQRQNRNEIKARPREHGDMITADIISYILEYVQNGTNYDMMLSEAFKDASITGLSWLTVYPDFSKDPTNGDISIHHVPFGEVFPDPHFVARDYSDAKRLDRVKFVHVDDLIHMYPDREEQIKTSKGASSSAYLVNEPDFQDNENDFVETRESWDYVYNKKPCILYADGRVVPVDTLDPVEVDAELEENKAQILEDHEIRQVRLTISTPDAVLYTDLDPYGTNMIPYVPVFCFFTPSERDWERKAFALPHLLKDAQSERNVRRTQLVEIQRRQIIGGWTYEEGSIDVQKWLDAFKTVPLLPYKRNASNPPAPVTPPQIPPELITYDDRSRADFTDLGLDQNYLGQIDEHGISGKVLSQRVRQTYASVQEVFDNLKLANIAMGKHITAIASANWYQDKIKRILGSHNPFETKQLEEQIIDIQRATSPSPAQMAQMAGYQAAYNDTMEDELGETVLQMQNQMVAQKQQGEQQISQIQERIAQIKEDEREFWADFDLLRNWIHYDIVYDEVRNNPTYRAATLQALNEAAQYGIQVPPEMIIEYMDIPNEVREAMMRNFQAQKEAAAKEAEVEMEVKRADAMSKIASAQYKQSKLKTEMEKMNLEKQREFREQDQGKSV